MPPTSDQDTNSSNATGVTSHTKLSQKAASAGLQIPTKNGRKNVTAKDSGGGVMAAVTKNKMTARSPPSRFESPEMKPAAMAPNENPITSPLLDALSSASLTTSPSQNTNEWAKNVPAFSTSPSNLISLGESPPTQPSSYEDRLSDIRWAATGQRVVPNGHLSSASPPAKHSRRPLSYHLDGNYMQGTDDPHPQIPAYAARRSSMYSTYPHPRYGAQPPLPHQSQPHFYGAPDADLLLSPPLHGLVPGENGYYCGFDRLPTTQDSTNAVHNVVITGYEGGFDVFTVSKRGLNKVAKIDGLRGGVYNAKILPRNLRGGICPRFPLVAVVIHGPVWTSSDTAIGDWATPEGLPQAHAGNARESPRAAGQSTNGSEEHAIEYYQTTVEIYSLSTKQRVATLLSAPKSLISIPISSPLFRAPPTVGSLTIRADSDNVIVASGTTGEVWIFSQGTINGDATEEDFKCIGKVWTSVTSSDWQQDDPNRSSILNDSDSTSRQQYRAPIVSLNGRWLAYCPSTASSQVSLRASVPRVSSSARVPGLNTQTPPQLPTVNCLVETPGGESVMKQLAQAATQEMIKGATYLGKQGVQAWNSYWNKPAMNQPPSGAVPYQNTAHITHQFPPTHGTPMQAPTVTKDPNLISILDLESLKTHGSSITTALHPLATFKVPHGCSFLSFSPSGLALFTASNKGDVQSVWDLMRIQYAKPSFLKTGSQGTGIQGPHVRQIAQFSRMTIARIIDVVWTSPHGERAAMVTEPGTVHILDLPASAFTWPPPRRKVSALKQDEEGAGLSAASVASSAVNTLWTAARPLVGHRRRSSTGISAITAASVKSQAGHGTQALAAGISRSVGAATGRMNEMRKSSSNKLHLPRSSIVPRTACIGLITKKRNDLVMVVGGGIVRLYSVKSRRADRPADKQKASRNAKYVEFRLAPLPDLKIAPEPVRDFQEGDLELTEKEDSRWNFKKPQAKPKVSRVADSSIPQAEIESNAPYQPFHTDRRVRIYTYSHEQTPLPSPSVSTLLSPLQPSVGSVSAGFSRTNFPSAFGGSIRTEILNVIRPQNVEDSIQSLSDHRALPPSAIERVMSFPGDSEDSEQIVITTRIRKSVRSSGEAIDANEEGFFEDDCEVLDFASQRV